MTYKDGTRSFLPYSLQTQEQRENVGRAQEENYVKMIRMIGLGYDMVGVAGYFHESSSYVCLKFSSDNSSLLQMKWVYDVRFSISFFFLRFTGNAVE